MAPTVTTRMSMPACSACLHVKMKHAVTLRAVITVVVDNRGAGMVTFVFEDVVMTR